MKKQLCAVALITTAALGANVQADDFTYLSGGLLYNQQGLLAESNSCNDKSFEAKEITAFEKEKHKQKSNGVGYYLNGSVGFENQVFVEGRVHHSRLLHQTLLGVGYHYPIMQQVDVYGLVGVSQRSIAFKENLYTKIKNSDNYEHNQHVIINYSDNLRPTIELGLKAQFNEVAGVRVAYRFAQFADKAKLAALNKVEKDFKCGKNLHEGHIGGYYKISDNLAAEAGYTYTASLKGLSVENKSIKDHAATIGLRYTF